MNNNQTIKKTILLDDNSLETEKLVQNGTVYPLNEVSFYKLKNGTSGYRDWAKRIFFMSIGWSFKIVSVLIVFVITFSTIKGSKDNLKLDISLWELVMVGFSLLVCLILYLIGGKYKNDKDELISQIDDFFKKK